MKIAEKNQCARLNGDGSSRLLLDTGSTHTPVSADTAAARVVQISPQKV
jgi:hypothetical protein